MTLAAYNSDLISQTEESISNSTFVKLSLGHYKGAEEGLKQIIIKRVVIKNDQQLSFTYRYKTKDIIKNYPIRAALDKVAEQLEQDFYHAGLFTTEYDLTVETDQKGKSHLKKMPATHSAPPTTSHDREKTRLITPEKSYLHELGITDKNGKVYSNAQDKYKQINHFIQIVDSLLKELDVHELHRVADMGSGKGYLSFALYDHLSEKLKTDIKLTGVEARKDMVELCNRIAQHNGLTGLQFAEGNIENYDSTGTDLLIALHACDTATDDAIWKGIQAGAKLILTAPCCHKQIRKEIEKTKQHNELDFLTKYGIFLERQAEMVTDGIRALILEYYGYSTKVFDFISDAHTPKNVMIAAVKNKKPQQRNDIVDEIKRIKTYFGIGYHELERLAGFSDK